MRISGITIPDEKQLEFGLTAVFGVGRQKAVELLTELSISPRTKPGDLSTKDENRIREKVESLQIEGDLKRKISADVKRLKDIGAYRGDRHAKRLPVRGQRTKTNARTLKGVKKTMGSGRRKLEKT
ncbi:30S ribosomal protein S13 [bacterium]|nr:30S ribosomal protein S13 [bacterium]|tara:strand:+ start:76 stop:453 length:378 start_codon:yes stop_codon:yes gene_type:complete